MFNYQSQSQKDPSQSMNIGNQQQNFDQKLSQLSQSLRLFCDQHQQELLTNLCSHPSCLRPLCPDCIDPHNKFHKSTNTFAEIDSIKNIKYMCTKKLNTGIIEIQKILDELENNMMITDGDDQAFIYLYQKTFSQIKRCKEQVQDLVNQYFMRVEEQYRQLVDQNNEKQGSMNQMLELLRNNLNELEFLQANMEGQSTLNTIKRVCVMDLKKMIERFRKQCRQTEIMKNPNQVQLCIDSQALDLIINDLNKYISVSTSPLVGRYMDLDGKNSQSQVPSQVMRQTQPQIALQSSFFDAKQNQSVIQTPLSSVINQQIEQPRQTQQNEFSQYFKNNPFFDQQNQKFLHFFQVGDNNLWLYDLNKQENWINIKITSSMPIPQFSKSIITSLGDIYLIGGTLSSGKKSSSIFYMDLKSCNLVEVGKMLIPRSSHSVVPLQDSIGILGGYSDGQTLIDQCELFDSKTGQISQLGNLTYPVASPGVCTFNNESIVKIGGIDYQCQICNQIEIFQDQQWKVLKLYKFQNIRLLSMCCCIQINQDEILVFGGYVENNQGSNQCFVFEINNFRAIFKSNLCSLPYAEGFWNNNPIIDQGQVFALQNTTDEQGEHCLEAERQILIFDGQIWK